MLRIKEFSTLIQKALPKGFVFENPGGGKTTVLGHSLEKVSYRRGSSTIYLSYTDMFDVYSHFRGMEVSSPDLKLFRPAVFDPDARPAGHSCNCTFLFKALNLIGLAGQIYGGGVRGNPFKVKFN
ncbi:hypothetical protein [Microbulbifer spongiae]|uniref:Uncharacterized protein n=1 Tax=Microbulbifer spongiae TaxID=2944933 RepID=A0ABY9E792_9GAMM|nr:hypothetical protein [Microbulbifer sp. MI-G]WKD48212.1 hypothetical protein M8T91_09695 [Microbulbifer sp. MI-G]